MLIGAEYSAALISQLLLWLLASTMAGGWSMIEIATLWVTFV
jgi:hypothetical protein